ncbi:MAG: proline racemase family protein [Trueperaceae bacterium]
MACEGPDSGRAAATGRVRFVDSHTEGEPTRVVVAGGPDLGEGSMAERLARLRRDHDTFRSAVVNEPRGSDVLVGALLAEPVDPEAAAGVIFFNNVGYLGMCGHGTIGLVTTLAHLGRIGPGRHRIETPAGDVTAELHHDGRVSVENVPSYRYMKGVQVRVQLRLAGGAPGIAPGTAPGTAPHVEVSGDVAYGGNWFFLVHDHGQEVELANVAALTDFAWRVRQGLQDAGIRGEGDAEIDHVELFVPADGDANARSFVLCPGRAYDRSPCGTGTSAMLACLAADGKLEPGRTWVQESVIGSRFEARYATGPDGRIRPVVTGRAYVTAEGTLLLDPSDPFRWGIR